MTSRLVRRLVSGVRSSWEASTTSWAWARRENSRASSRRLKVRRRRPSSSGPPGERRRVTSVVSARSSTVSVRELSGTSAVWATSHPNTTARRTPIRATAPSTIPRRSSSELTSSRVAIWRAPPSVRSSDPKRVPGGRGSTSSRSWSPPTSTVVKKDGASPAATSRAWGVIGRSPPETSVPCESMTCPSVAVVVLICWPAVIFLAAAVRDSSAAPSSELRAARKEAVEATSTATTTATVVARTRRVRKVTRPAGCTPRLARCGCTAARHPPRSCDGGSPHRRPASWSRSRSRSPTPC